MLKLFERLLGRPTIRGSPAEDEANECSTNDLEEFAWMFPPSSMVDATAWDKYWNDQMANEVAGLVDMFCDDGELVDVMRASGLRSVLCVGNGISQEPRALASIGFDVVALELSPVASDIAERAAPPADYLAQLVGGRSPMAKGQLQFVVGDLVDESICPGPYDVVIERRTIQLYSDAERPGALRAVADRLASPGIFYSHCHDGAWRPPGQPKHVTAAWFDKQGWRRWHDSQEGPVEGRVAWTFTTTG